MPEISVIMPVYNTEETFLRHAIESILVQSFADFELIVVNDGANAQTTLVIDKYATEDKRIKVIHNPVNKGVSFARNIGKNQAVGEFIMFVDADDVCHPELLQILYQTLVDNQADIAGCCVKNITQDHEFENQNAGHPKIKIFANPLDAFMKKRNISLSTWFKEYLYIPLGGNRVSKRRNLFNLFVVFLATGIWHGASWNFVFWGLWHGIFIIFEKITGWHKRSGGLKINIAQHLYTIFAFVIGWVMFRADNMAYACEYIKNMFGLIAEHQITYKLPYYIDNIEIIAFTAAVFCAMPLFKGMLDIKYKHKVLRTLVNVWLILLFVLSSAEIAASTYNPFIYFRF